MMHRFVARILCFCTMVICLCRSLKSIATLFGSDLAAGKSISHGLGTQKKTELAEDRRAKKGEDERKRLKKISPLLFFETNIR